MVLDWSVVDPMVEKPTQAVSIPDIFKYVLFNEALNLMKISFSFQWAEMFPIGKSDKTDLTYQTFAKFEAGKSTRL